MASCGAPDGCLSNPNIKSTAKSAGSQRNNEVPIMHAEGIKLHFIYLNLFSNFKCDLVIEYNREYCSSLKTQGTFIVYVVSIISI